MSFALAHLAAVKPIIGNGKAIFTGIEERVVVNEEDFFVVVDSQAFGNRVRELEFVVAHLLEEFLTRFFGEVLERRQFFLLFHLFECFF